MKAIGNDTKYLDSELSVVKTVYKLQTPSFKIQDDKYVWENVANASSYVMMIDGVKVSDEFNREESKYSYVPRYTSAGEHSVTLQAIGDGRRYLNSNEGKLLQTAEILQTPVFSYKYSNETVVPGGSITVTITTASPHALKYQYDIAGVSLISSDLSCSKVIDGSGKCSICVKALGGLSDDGIYYIDSPRAGSETDAIILLAAPNIGNFNFYFGTIRWGSVSFADYGYDYQISYNGAAWGDEILHTADPSIPRIDNYSSYRTITIRVRARGGNNGKTVTSEWIEFTWTNPNL